jgi:hypothetical protein
MNRGDRREAILTDDQDRLFLAHRLTATALKNV